MITLMVLTGATLFTACKKNDNDMVSASTTAAQMKPAGNAAAPRIYFKEAAMNAKTIKFENNGKLIYMQELSNPINLSAVLDHEIPRGPYDNYSMTIAAIGRDDIGSLMIKGYIPMENGKTREVNFIMRDDVTLVGSGKMVMNQPTSFFTFMNIALDKLGANIPPDRLTELTNGSDRIEISANANPDLYRTVIESLSTMVKINPAKPEGPLVSTVTYESAAQVK